MSATPIPADSPNGTQLTVVAIFRARPGLTEELGRRLNALVEPTRRETGCINYDLHQSVDDPNVWLMYENWISPDDLTSHFEMPHLKDFVASVGEVLEGKMNVMRLVMTTAPGKA